MSYKPNGTIYLCANTGLDRENAIWLHDFAYPAENDNVNWLSTFFQWLKAHAVTKGHWHTTYTSEIKGYVQIGRNPFNSDTTLYQEDRIEKPSHVNFPETEKMHYEEGLQDIDYIVFVNGDGSQTGQTYYAFVTKLENVNINCVRVHFEIDTIMTYQQSFYFGRCHIDREHVFEERKDHLYGLINKFNTFSDYFTANQLLEYRQKGTHDTDLNFGKGETLVLNSDVDMEKINAEGSGLNMAVNLDSIMKLYKKIYNPAPMQVLQSNVKSSDNAMIDIKIAPTMYIYTTLSQISLQYLANLNGLDHILECYAVPTKILSQEIQTRQEYDNNRALNNDKSPSELGLFFKSNVKDYMSKESVEFEIKIPSFFDDWRPLNAKLYTGNYVKIELKSRYGSIFITLDDLDVTKMTDVSNIITLRGVLNLSIVRNLKSTLHFKDSISSYNEFSPFLYDITMDRYCLLPSQTRDAIRDNNKPIEYAKILGNLMNGATNPYGAIASAVTGQVNKEFDFIKTSKTWSEKGIGNNNFSSVLNMSESQNGFVVIVHRPDTDSMKRIDRFFSMYGYNQDGMYKYPNINTRKHFNFVKLEDVNIQGTKSAYSRFGTTLTTEHKNDVIERMKNGVTFWNLREKLGQSYVLDFQGFSSDVLNRNFVTHYTEKVFKENASFTGGYMSGLYNENGDE